MTADVRFNYRLRLKSHVALALFIYLYLNEDTESLIKVVIVADSGRRGSWMSGQTGPRVQTERGGEGVSYIDRPPTLVDPQPIRTSWL